MECRRRPCLSQDRGPHCSHHGGLGLSRKGIGQILSLLGLQDSLSDPEDILDRERCLETLAALRHAKWFQVRSRGGPSGDSCQP